MARTLRKQFIGSFLFPILTASAVIGLAVFVSALQDENRDQESFWELTKQSFGLRGVQHFIQECRSERRGYSNMRSIHADFYVCRWPDFRRAALNLEKLSSDLDRDAIETELAEKLERDFRLAPAAEKSDMIFRATSQMQHVIWAVESLRSYFVDGPVRRIDLDPLTEIPAQELYRFIKQRRSAKYECLSLMRVWPPDQTFSTYIYKHFENKTDLGVCYEAFDDRYKTKNIRYGKRGKRADGSGSFSFNQTRYLLAGLEMLPDYLNERRLNDLTLPELASIGDIKRKELEDRRKYMAGSDLISPIEPLPQLPFILVMWLFLFLVPICYLSMHLALKRLIEDRQLPQRKWVAFALLPRSHFQRALNYTLLIVPMIALLFTIFCCPSLAFRDAAISLHNRLPEQSRVDDLSRILTDSPYIKVGTFESLSVNVYQFILDDQSRVVKIANLYFLPTYLMALLFTLLLSAMTFMSRRKCIRAIERASINDKALSSEP